MTSAQDLIKKDKQYLSPALTKVFPIVAERGEGSYLFSTDGEKYLDLTAGIGVTQLGHCHPEVVEAARLQLEKLQHICVTHYEANIGLAEKLAEILPGNLNSTFFCNSGAEAVEGSMKLAKRLNPGRPNIIAFRGSFHGRTTGCTSLSSSKVTLRNEYDPLLPGVNFIDYPKHSADDSLAEMEKIFNLHLPPESVSAIIIEPVLGEGGYIPVPLTGVNFLKELRKISDKYGITLICDEVQSGFGRTGKWFATEHYGIEPDIITMAKGIANGLPLGGFAAPKEKMDKLSVGTHGSTFGGNMVCCAAAHKTVEIIERDNILDHVTSVGNEVMDFFKKELDGVAEIRGLGFMIGVELQSKEVANKVTTECFEKEKMLVLTCGVEGKTLRLIPPLNTSREVLMDAAEKISNIIKKES